jgi:hypothetical protein
MSVQVTLLYVTLCCVNHQVNLHITECPYLSLRQGLELGTCHICICCAVLECSPSRLSNYDMRAVPRTRMGSQAAWAYD